MTAYVAGCICLACMAALALPIIGPGLRRAIDILFPSALPHSPVADPQPRVEGVSARPTVEAGL